MRLSTFIVVSAMGRMLGTYMLTLQGVSIQTQNYSMALVIVAGAVLIFLVAFLYRTALFRWIKSTSIEKSPYQ